MQNENKQSSEQEKNISFQAKLEGILSTPLSPENINMYADHALEQVIDLAQDAVEAYSRQPTVGFTTTREQEEAAFRYFSIGDVDRTLDYIDSKAREIRDLDSIIGNAHKSEAIITPPMTGEITILQGQGIAEYHEKRGIPRLKTLLFVASNSFGVNVKDPEQVTLTEGALSDEMIRKAPYYLVEMPKINRTILICDEEANATFIFNNEYMKEYGITPQDLIPLKKHDLEDLIDSSPVLGKKLKYYPATYVAKLVYFLSDKWTVEEPNEGEFEQTEQYLYPFAPDGYMNKDAIWKHFGVAESTVKRSIQDLGIEVAKYRSGKGSNVSPHYSPEDIEKIRVNLEEKGALAEPPPEGYEYLEDLSSRWPVSPYSIALAITELGLEGHVFKQRGRRPAKYYSPDDIVKINDLLDEKGLLMPPPPEGYRGLTDLMRDFDFKNVGVIQKGINELGLKSEDFRISNGVIPHYSPEDIEKLAVYFEERGYFAGAPPEGYQGVPEIAETLGVGLDNVRDAIEKCSLTHEIYKGRSNRQERFYSSDDIATIREYLENTGRLHLEVAPEGYFHKDALWRVLNVPETFLKKAIHQLGIEGHMYRMGTQNRPLIYYSPDEIIAIREWMAQDHSEEDMVPDDGWRTANGLAKDLELDVTTINHVLKETGLEGSIRRSHPGAQGFVYYSPAHIETISVYLKEKGYYAEFPPEGYLTRTEMEDTYKVSFKIITKLIEGLKAEPTIYKSPRSKRPQGYYGPEVVEAVKQESLKRINKIGSTTISQSE